MRFAMELPDADKSIPYVINSRKEVEEWESSFGKNREGWIANVNRLINEDSWDEKSLQGVMLPLITYGYLKEKVKLNIDTIIQIAMMCNGLDINLELENLQKLFDKVEDVTGTGCTDLLANPESRVFPNEWTDGVNNCDWYKNGLRDDGSNPRCEKYGGKSFTDKDGNFRGNANRHCCVCGGGNPEIVGVGVGADDGRPMAARPRRVMKLKK